MMRKPIRFQFPIYRDPELDPPVFWIAHPLGSYFDLTYSEAILALSNGAAVESKPNKLLAEKMAARMLDRTE